MSIGNSSRWSFKKSKGVFKGFSAYYCHNTHVAQVAEVELEDGYPIVKKVICAVDCGILVNPIGGNNQAVGGIIDGIGHAMYGDFEFKKGVPNSKNFDKFELIRMSLNEVKWIVRTSWNWGGVGIGVFLLLPMKSGIGIGI